jgi:hypothetical protein
MRHPACFYSGSEVPGEIALGMRSMAALAASMATYRQPAFPQLDESSITLLRNIRERRPHPWSWHQSRQPERKYLVESLSSLPSRQRPRRGYNLERMT